MQQEFTSSNIKFLREGMGMDIATISGILNIDPLDFYILERDGFNIKITNEEKDAKLINFVSLCEFFTVYLDELVYSDFTNEVKFDVTKFSLLKKELKGSNEIDRRFRVRHPNRNEWPATENVELDTLKEMLRLIHETIAIQNEYFFRRIHGSIDKIDFLEK